MDFAGHNNLLLVAQAYHSGDRPRGSQLTPRTDTVIIRVRFHIIRNARIENVGKSQSCMVSERRELGAIEVRTAQETCDEPGDCGLGP